MSGIYSRPVHRQHGFSKGALIFGSLFLAIAISMGVKLIPVYVDHNFVTGIVRSMLESGNAASMSQNQMRQEIANSLRINNIRDFDTSSITVQRASGVTRVSIRYEKRIPLIYNIDMVVSFDDLLE